MLSSRLWLQTFEEFGIEAVKITRVERPAEYLKIVAGILPKELEIVDNRLAEVSDDELDAFIELARQRRLAIGRADEARRPDDTLRTGWLTTARMKSRSNSTPRVMRTARDSSWLETSSGKLSRADSRRQCTPPVAILTGGRANGLTGLSSAGPAASRARWCGTPYKRSWLAERASKAREQSLRMP